MRKHTIILTKEDLLNLHADAVLTTVFEQEEIEVQLMTEETYNAAVRGEEDQVIEAEAACE